MALAVTGGYRARMAWSSATAGNPTDGLYFGANYHFLKGFHYENFDLGARLDTDNSGLLTVNPVAEPLVVNRFTGSSGRGFAIDVGMAAVKNRWEIGFGVNGIANRIEWADVERTDYFLSSLVGGGDFTDRPAVFDPASRVERPVDGRANAAYNADAFTVIAEFADGFNGTTFRGGYEHKFNRVQLRGGGRYVEDRFEPTGGVGFNFSNRVGVDVAAFATSANLERKREHGHRVLNPPLEIAELSSRSMSSRPTRARRSSPACPGRKGQVGTPVDLRRRRGPSPHGGAALGEAGLSVLPHRKDRLEHVWERPRYLEGDAGLVGG